MTNINSEQLNQKTAMANMTKGRSEPMGSVSGGSPDQYGYYDEGGNLVYGSRSQDELNDNLDVLKKNNREMVRTFNKLSEFDGMSAFNSFQEEAAAIIDEVEGLKGALYTREGKNAEIKKRLNKLADSKVNEADKTEKSFSEQHAELAESMEKELNKRDEMLTRDEVAEINLRNSELQGEIRGKLYSMNDTRSLEHEFKMMVDNSRHDKKLARFLENNYYLFLDKVQSLETGEMDKQRAISKISSQVDELKKKNHSKKARSLMAVKDNLSEKRYFTTSSKRLIKSHLNNYLKKY